MSSNSPYFRQSSSVQSIMLRVLLALLPGLAAYVWFFGGAILVQLALASLAALAGEAAVLHLRNKPLGQYLGDGSALVTAWLVALTLPPLVPWWLTVAATLFAIVIVKQLYGGVGQNPFNPAIAAFCVMIVAFPQLMSQWPSPVAGQGFSTLGAQLQVIFGAPRELDALTMATAIDSLRTGLHAAGSEATVASLSQGAAFGQFGAQGWEWVAGGYLLGGLWLLQQRLISWHIPVAFIATLAALAGIAQLAAPASQAGALFHLFSGGTMLAAFFIATDPITAASTPRGKLIYAAGIALITWVIRSFGAYPDGIAFATLLMNIAVPLIDLRTQPAVFGRKP